MHITGMVAAMDTTITTVKQLGGALIQARRDLNLTQAEVATQARVSLRWLVSAETGQASGASVGRILQVLRTLDKALVVIDAPRLRGGVHQQIRQAEV